MIHFAQSHYNKVAEHMAHNDVALAENMGYKTDRFIRL